MKILLATLEYPPQIGGVASYYGNLIRHWSPDDVWQVVDNSQNLLLASRGILPWRRALLTLRRAINKNKPDFLFLGQILPLGTVAWVLHYFKPLPYGIFLHGMDLSFALRSRRKRLLTRLILRKARIIVCANSRVQKILLNFYPAAAAKVVLINPGASAGKPVEEIKDRLIQEYGLADKKIIFSMGRLVKRKGFDQVIAALAKVPGENWRYLLAGDGPEREALQALATASPQSQKIIFLGSLGEEEKWSCLDLCDIFIMTSRDLAGDFEGFGIVYLEANLMGRPVIAGNSGGVGDAVINMVNGLVVDSENQEEIAEAINQLLASDDLKKKLGRQGKVRAEVEFTWSKQAETLRQYLSSLKNL
ncbi:MAG TPA: glycosyltransferase family 4 protein [bacterium]|nr:MAG: GDP-mannose-dependent alpha-(1-6)-phosphatidylinositol monomannoside mannosyltransferase [Parcubacteria group bacterium ADurb.Bin115]HNU81481.1 glycosyltransferase family 4 protein [bacterium]HOD86969.1 glycosyltransferase family 4 protein [bacterium]HPW05628.1 glycosyltransferase family 4 protein [bacterium]HPY99268.1 glycosyltransferase family 4 protein [bacterium]